MASKPGRFQPRFTGGQIDPLMNQNTDVDIFAKAAADLTNLRPLPQGGFTTRDGLARIARCRGLMNQVALSPASTSLSIAGVGSAPALLGVFTLQGAAGLAISAIDVNLFGAYLPGGTPPTLTQPNPVESPLIQGRLYVNYWNGRAWLPLMPPLALTDTLRTRRFAVPPGQSVVTTQVQLLASTGVVSGATVVVGSVVAWADSGAIAVYKYRQFNVSAQLVYDLVFSQNNVDVFKGSTWVAAIPLAQTGAQVAQAKSSQQLSDMILTHQDFAPQLIQRQGADNEWQVQPAPFAYVPNYDFGDTVYSNFTPSIWTLTFVNFDTQLSSSTPPLPSGGAHFTVSVNGVASTAIQQPPGAWAGTAAAILAAILSLPGVAPGVTVMQTQTQSNFTTFQVTFGGAANQGNGWAISANVLDKADAAVTAQQYQLGVAGGEPIMSNARGWPAAVCLYQERAVFGGFKGLPLGLLFSQQGNPWQLDTRMTASTSAFLAPLDGQGDETILDVHLGRTLNVFTTYGEWWFTPGALSATSPPTITYSTSNGIAQSVEPIETEGVTVFTHRSQGLLLEYFYEYQFQNYSAKPISTAASRLVQGVVDNALQTSVASVDTNRHYLVLANGQAAMRATMRTEEVNAFAPVVTDGSFLAVGVNANVEACWIVQRQVAGVPVVFFEKMQSGLWLDCAQTFPVAAGQTSIAGLADFVGANVWAIVDGFVQGPFTVGNAATIALEFAALAAGTATVGRWTAPLGTTLPLPREVGPKTVVRRPARAHTVWLSLFATTSVAISANRSPVYEVALKRYGQAPDVPLSAQPFSGWTKLEGFPGYNEDVQVTITQTRPGALTVTGVVIEADI